MGVNSANTSRFINTGDISMYELIKIEEKDGNQLINARELHEKLQVETRFADWIKRQIERARLIENIHYVILKNEKNSEGRPQKEYALTIDGAIHITSMHGGEIGFNIRDHLISFRKNPLNFLSKSQLFEMALESEKEKERLQMLSNEQQKQIEQLKPANEFVNNVFKQTNTSIKIGEFAQVVKIPDPKNPKKLLGQNKMFKLLRHLKILKANRNLPMQQYLESGYFEVKEQIKEGIDKIFFTTYVTPKGQTWLHRRILEAVG